MITFPNAKINIGLNITAKRKDGYHSIESIFYPISLCDVMEVIESGEGADVKCHFTGLSIEGNSDSNLCVKAYHLLKDEYSLPPIQLYLHKIIPMGAGLGGGSSDGAFCIKLLDQKFGLNLTQEKMMEYAGALGSDCPFFIKNRPAYVEGRGEQMRPVKLDLSSYKLLLVYPGIHISTQEAYSLIKPQKPLNELEALVTGEPVEKWKSKVKNDFELPLFEKYPLLNKIKDELYEKGALYASMTGSGSAIYGIFKDLPDMKSKLFGELFVWLGH